LQQFTAGIGTSYTSLPRSRSNGAVEYWNFTAERY